MPLRFKSERQYQEWIQMHDSIEKVYPLPAELTGKLIPPLAQPKGKGKHDTPFEWVVVSLILGIGLIWSFLCLFF